MALTLKIGGGFKYPNIIFKTLINLNVLKKINIIVYDAFKDCRLSGGRINIFSSSYNQDIHNLYNKFNIRQSLVLSNSFASNSAYNTCKKYLKLFYQDGNEIIVQNYWTSNKVHNDFPLYKQVYSITGVNLNSINCNNNDLIMYKKLEDRFDYIVPRCEHVLQPNFQNNVNPSKYEIMLNDTCKYGCPYWKKHFQKYHELNFNDSWKKCSKQKLLRIHECWLKNFNPYRNDIATRNKYGKYYGMDLTSDQIRFLINRGFRRFKISGRELSKDMFEDEIKTFVKRVKDAVS